jgi:hypothetical protein
MVTPLARRLFVFVLLCVPFASGCACSRNDLWDRVRDRERERLDGSGPEASADQFERAREDADSAKELREQRTKNEADFRARNPGR